MKPIFLTYSGSDLQRGFSLLEMMVVVAVLAAVAFISTGAYENIHEQTDEQLVHVEMQQIAKAIRQFKQDTGYYPKEGPFDLAVYGGAVPYGNLLVHAGGAGGTDPEKDLWFYSPANFYQLISRTSPLNATGHMLETWNPETGRGWRGPYLMGFAEGYVDIRAGINNGTIDGNSGGDPLASTNIPDVDGIADPFEYRGKQVGANTLLDWSREPNGPIFPFDPNNRDRERWGRPYLLFNLTTAPMLVSMGADGTYDQAAPTSDDIMLNIE
jgi:prepilin-type N-terminal cleavage/methylation domain-containing protein